MICNEYEALLDLYVDGELTPEEFLRVQAHLEKCPYCRAYVDDAMAMRLAFPEAEETELPEGFHESVMARIAESAPAVKKPARRWWKTLAPVAAACFAVMLLTVRGGLVGGTEKSAAAQAPAAAAPYAMDITTAEEGECIPAEEPAAEAPAASAPAADDPSYELAITAKSENAPLESIAGTGPLADQDLSDSEEYAAVLTLTADEAAGIDLLASMERMEFSDGSSGYLLSREDYEALLSLLPEADPADDLPAGEPLLVRIQD